MVETPKPEDVLFDQLEFLLRVRVDHLRLQTYCDCDDCKRFNRVSDVLMEPFQEKTEDAVKSQQRKAKKAGV